MVGGIFRQQGSDRDTVEVRGTCVSEGGGLLLLVDQSELHTLACAERALVLRPDQVGIHSQNRQFAAQPREKHRIRAPVSPSKEGFSQTLTIT